MDDNPYKPPSDVTPTPVPPLEATAKGTDWFALGGLFVGVVTTVLIGSTTGLYGLVPGGWEPGAGEVLVSVTITGAITLIGWLAGRWLR